MARAFATLGCMAEPPPNPKAWLFRVASNLWIDQKRRTREDPRDASGDAEGRAPDEAHEPRAPREARGTLIGRLSPQKWMYHTGADILGVLIARAEGMSLEDFMAERVFAPLGMKDTAFSVPAEKLDRLATCYRVAGGKLSIFDPGRGGRWSRPPVFT